MVQFDQLRWGVDISKRCFNHPIGGEEREKGREEQHQWVCLLVLLSCNINPLKQVRTDTHTSKGEHTEHTHFWRSGLKLKVVRKKRGMEGAEKADCLVQRRWNAGSDWRKSTLSWPSRPSRPTMCCCVPEESCSFLSGGPESGQKHPKNRGTQSDWGRAWVARPKPGKVENYWESWESHRAQVLLLYILFFLLPPSVLLLHKHSQTAAALIDRLLG